MKIQRTVLLCLLVMLACVMQAQVHTIMGSLIDKDTKEGVLYTPVQLLNPDSSYVAGTTTDGDGKFTLTAPKEGKYIVRFSGIGYRALTKNVIVDNDKEIQLGQLQMKADSKTLQEVTVVGQAAKVVLKEDTFQYNASAYHVPEGSTIEALVKRLPGAEVSDDGTIKINGKEVKKILVDGKEFMVGDTKTAMKNLPTSIVEKVKAYDQQSDLSRVTGIDDGEEQTVLDFGIKKGMNKGMFGNLDLGVGTHSRYAEKAMGAYFKDGLRMMGFGRANNVNDMGFGGGPRGGFGGLRQGLNATKMVGLNLNYEKKNLIQLDGSVRWNHSDGNLATKVASENFVSSSGSFANRLSQNYSRTNSWDARFRMEWTPDSMWNIMFRPSISLKKTDGRTISSSAAFNEDPYEYVDNPLDDASIEQLAQEDRVVNKQKTTTISYGDATTANGMIQVNRKLSGNGRNVTLRVDGNYSDEDSKTFSIQDLQYFQLMDMLGQDSTYQAYRYNLMPTKNWGYAVKAVYSEPIANKTYLQFSYQYKYSFSKSDRSTYDFSRLNNGVFDNITPAYRSWDSYLACLTEPLADYFDQGLSRYSEYRTYTHNFQLMLRMNQTKWRLNAGVMLQPQHSSYMQDYLGVHVDTVRNVVNWSPTLDFRYRFSKQSNLRINYRGTATQPSMSQLLDIVDNTDPQNVQRGNPGLKPSFTNRLRFFYNNYIQNHQRSIMTFLNLSSVRNAIGNSVSYNSQTGARTVQPVNVNGNWDANAAVMFNTSLDSAGVWNVNTFTTMGYNRYASYLQLRDMEQLAKNITKSTTVGERLSASYRKSWIELELDGSLNYTHSKNAMQAASNLNTWQYAYGANLTVTLPWGTSLSTDLHEQSRRGYSDASLNTNELLWNAQLSQSFLKENALTVSVQWFDILQQQSNLSRTITAMSRTDTEYNSINSYLMFKATYRFNLFGGKEARSNMRENGRFNRGEGPMGPPHP